ncbi:MAG: ORC-CDC6 family AAA ATPase [Thermoplasmataceae archaeon]
MNVLDKKYEKFLPLIRKILDGKCVILLGAGVSSENGIVDSSQLIKELCEYYKMSEKWTAEKNCEDLTLDETVSYYHALWGDHVAQEKIKEIIEESQKKIDPDRNLYKYFSSWPKGCLYVTTNYDTLLENAFKETIGVKFMHVVYKEDHMSNLDDKKINIIKLHGSIEDYLSILSTNKEIEDVKNSKSFNHILSMLNYKDLLLFGQSSKDADILNSTIAASVKNSTVYAIARDEVTLKRFQAMKFVTIQEDLRTTIDELTILINDKSPQNPEKITTYKGEFEKDSRTTSSDHNPFKFWTTDGLNNDDFKELLDVFVEPTYAGFSKIYNPDKHNIVQGARGTGKTVLLRGLSLEYNKDFNQNKYFGFWLPMTTQFMGTIQRTPDMNDIEWYNYFASYMSTFIVEKSLESISYLNRTNSLEFEDTAIKAFIDELKSDFNIDKTEINNLDEMYNQISKYREEKYYTYDEKVKRIHPTYYRRYFENILPKLDKRFVNKYIFVVLDDAHYLSVDQKKVIVTFLANRTRPISFKIGTAYDFEVYTDYFGTVIQDSKDYETVYLDRISGDTGIKQYSAFLENLTNIRLQKAGQNITVSKLLPSYLKRPSKGVHYAGFNDYVTLASQITRDYITLLKDTINYEFKDINSKYVKLTPISPQTQDTIINIKSAIKLSDINNADLDSPKLGVLVNALGKLFRTIYTSSLNSGSGEIRTTTGIEIKNFGKLTEDSKNIVKKGIELQVLQIPMTNRLRKPTDIPYSGIKFHRLLCPYFKLKLGYRYPKTLRAEEINHLIVSGETYIDKFVKNGTRMIPKGRQISRLDDLYSPEGNEITEDQEYYYEDGDK